MKVGVVLAVLAVAPFAGCAGGTTNPHLLSPKLVIHARHDATLGLYLHSAFGEHAYDRMELAIDNVTVDARTEAFSLETQHNRTGFFVEVTAVLERETYRLRARVDVEPAAERARLVVLDDEGKWGGEETYALPYERVVERVSA